MCDTCFDKIGKWKACFKAISAILVGLARFQVENDYLTNVGFTPEAIKTKSGAAAGLCSWVINICKYFRIYQVNGPIQAPSDNNLK